jgi:hypothetical protein
MQYVYIFSWGVYDVTGSEMAAAVRVHKPWTKDIQYVPQAPRLCFVSYHMVNVKVELSLSLTKHHATEAYWGSGGVAPRILDLNTR